MLGGSRQESESRQQRLEHSKACEDELLTCTLTVLLLNSPTTIEPAVCLVTRTWDIGSRAFRKICYSASTHTSPLTEPEVSKYRSIACESASLFDKINVLSFQFLRRRPRLNSFPDRSCRSICRGRRSPPPAGIAAGCYRSYCCFMPSWPSHLQPSGKSEGKENHLIAHFLSSFADQLY